jgi:hypothetical protein
MRSPADYRAVTSARRELTPHLSRTWGADHTSVRRAGGSLADVGLRNRQASEVRSGSPGTVVARITRCVSAPRSVAQLRWRRNRRRKRAAATNERGDEAEDANESHGHQTPAHDTGPSAWVTRPVRPVRQSRHPAIHDSPVRKRLSRTLLYVADCSVFVHERFGGLALSFDGFGR